MLKTAYLNSFVFRRDHFNALRQNFITTMCNEFERYNQSKQKKICFRMNTYDWFEHWNRSKQKKKHLFFFNEILTIDLNIEIRLNERKKHLFSNEYLGLIWTLKLIEMTEKKHLFLNEILWANHHVRIDDKYYIKKRMIFPVF